jgi:predicted RNA-binding Zn-ribbon protein involved in translation (DUF1610 family)
MEINCPQCEQKYELDESMVNQNVECQSCNNNFIVSDNRERVACPMCSELILKAARICQYCKSPLADGVASTNQVHVAGMDPFAEYHSDIKGKKKGPLTIIGMLGIALACLVIAVGIPLLTKGDGEEGFTIVAIGAFIGIACYLWARGSVKSA